MPPVRRLLGIVGASAIAAAVIGLRLSGGVGEVAAHGSGHKPAPGSPTRTAASTAVRADLQTTPAGRVLRVLGQVRAKPELVAHVTSPIWGRLEADPRPMTVGQPVRKGEPLAKLILELSADERYLMEARKVEIAAAAAVARTRKAQADREFRQAIALLRAAPDNAYRRLQVDAAERLLKAATEEETLYDRQEKNFDLVIQRRDPRITIIQAPIDGVITDVAVRTGERNLTGNFRQLCTVTDLSRVWIAAEVFERDAGLALGATRATYRLPGDATARDLGAPVVVMPWIDEQKRTLTMMYEVPNRDRRLSLGMTVDIEMPVGQPVSAASAGTEEP